MSVTDQRTGGRRVRAVAAVGLSIAVLMAMAPAKIAHASTANTWANVAAMPTPVAYFGAATGADGTIYAVGGDPTGGGGGAGSTDALQAYDTKTNTWVTRAPLPTPRSDHGAAAGTDGRIYAVGGLDGTGGFRSPVDVYNPGDNTWTTGASLLQHTDGTAVAAGKDGRIYAFGGYGPSPSTSNGGSSYAEAYTPSTNTWAAIPLMPHARAYAAATTGPDGRIYVLGGQDGPIDGSEFSAADVYTPSTNSWFTLPSMPSTHYQFAAATGADGRIYAIGGQGAGAGDVVHAYDPNTNAWTTVTVLISSRTGHAATTGLDGKIYAIGGVASPGKAPLNLVSVEAYTSLQNNAADFDGDQRTDLSVFRPGNGTWYTSNSGGSPNSQIPWGMAGDTTVPADYDGTGSSQVAIYRPSTGQWFVRHANGTYTVTTWGQPGGSDIPVPADYQGVGKADLAIYRPSTGQWFVLNQDGSFTATTWGAPGGGDIPVPARYETSGQANIAVFRPSTGTWYVLNILGGFTATAWGQPGDIPVPGDYQAYGKANLAIYRPSTGAWFVLKQDGSYTGTVWGAPGNTDIPQPGDFTGDGKIDLTVYRPGSPGLWYTLPSDGRPYTATPLGVPGDVPTVLTAAIGHFFFPSLYN